MPDIDPNAPQAVVARLYAAFTQRDLETLRRCLAPDVLWVQWTDRAMQATFAHVYTVHEGRIVHFEQVAASAPAAEVDAVATAHRQVLLPGMHEFVVGGGST